MNTELFCYTTGLEINDSHGCRTVVDGRGALQKFALLTAKVAVVPEFFGRCALSVLL